jgi:hypothetical protein
MPNSIPFDHPSLVLGNVVDTKVLGILNKIAGANSSTDAAQTNMNSLIAMKRSLNMTISELLDMEIDVSPLEQKIKDLDTSISKSAGAYISARLKNETTIQKLRSQLAELDQPSETLESPIDFQQSEIIQKPLSAESLKLDAQYFSFESTTQKDVLANIESYIKDTTNELGSKSNEIAQKVTAQVVQQHKNHSIVGTLIISSSCTHKNISLFEPLVISKEKAIKIWNHNFPNQSITEIELQNGPLNKPEQSVSNSKALETISIITGATYGSCFIGMIHILKEEQDLALPSDEELSNLKNKLSIGGWLERVSGGIGIEESIYSEVQKILNPKKISSHITIVSMGAVPSIASNKIAMGIKANSTNENSTISNDSESSFSTIQSDIADASEENQNISLMNQQNQGVIQSLQKIDQDQNKVLDINSLMAAFENYISIIKEGSDDGVVGVPIKFYIRKYTRKQLIKLKKNSNASLEVKSTQETKN